MGFTSEATAHILLALIVTVASSHLFGMLFQKFRQPAVIGEIFAGIVLGPSLLGYYFTKFHSFIFLDSVETKTVLAALAQLGLIFLMFSSGLEVKSLNSLKQMRSSLYMAITGCIIPFSLTAIALQYIDMSSYYGEAQHSLAFLIILAVSLAVTSIPVISRIFIDLGIIEGSFARTVIISAIIEDMALYIALGVALGLVALSHGSIPLPAQWVNLHDSNWEIFLYHIVVHLVFFFVSLKIGPFLLDRLSGTPWNLIDKKSPIGSVLVSIFLVTIIGHFLGLSIMFAAFCSGCIIGSMGEKYVETSSIIRQNSFGFSIPVYFFTVGMNLNLAKYFNILHFTYLLIVASMIKAYSVYLGARLAGEPAERSKAFAVAMNARGGPGIVVASVSFHAGIINEPCYVLLVLLAIFTSLAAGSWLERAVKKNQNIFT